MKNIKKKFLFGVIGAGSGIMFLYAGAITGHTLFKALGYALSFSGFIFIANTIFVRAREKIEQANKI